MWYSSCNIESFLYKIKCNYFLSSHDTYVPCSDSKYLSKSTSVQPSLAFIRYCYKLHGMGNSRYGNWMALGYSWKWRCFYIIHMYVCVKLCRMWHILTGYRPWCTCLKHHKISVRYSIKFNPRDENSVTSLERSLCKISPKWEDEMRLPHAAKCLKPSVTTYILRL